MDNESTYSIGRSLLTPANIIDYAIDGGYTAVALTDLMSINGMVEFFKYAEDKAIKPIIGCKVRVMATNGTEDGYFLIVIYVRNDQGLSKLMKILSSSKTNKKGVSYVEPSTIKAILADGGDDLLVSTCFDDNPLRSDLCGACYLDIISTRKCSFIQINPEKTPLHIATNRAALNFCIDNLDKIIYSPIVMANTARYHSESDADALDVLAGITTNTPIDKPWFRQRYLRNECPMSAAELESCRNGSKDNSDYFASLCTYIWKPSEVSLPKMAEDEDAKLDDLINIGWANRFSGKVSGYLPDQALLDTTYKERVEYEVGVLKSLGFTRYFLLVEDLVSWAKSVGIEVSPGRGSVGGSLVAYLLGITDVDPIRFGLFFERFINPDRLDLPDADLDFQSSRRHEVVAYLKGKYGRNNVASISNFNRLGPSSALRDTGRMFGLTPKELFPTKLIPAIGVDLEEARKSIPEVEKFAKENEEVWDIATRLVGCVRSIGQHAAAVVVTNDSDGFRLGDRAVIIEKDEIDTVNWDKRVVEYQGLVKLDILGLSTLDLLAQVKDTVGGIDLLSIPLDGKDTLQAFAEGNTKGVFQMESGGMVGVLKSLAQAGDLDFNDICVTTALYRPGPMESGLLESYIRRRQGFETVYYDHPSMEPALNSTLGIMVFQEQTMQIARDLAGYSMSEADGLRKIMGKKLPEEMAKQRDKFVDGSVATGLTRDKAETIFDQVDKFAGYAFNLSHSVEYSLLSYWSMYMKTHYPAEFYAAALTIANDQMKVKRLVLDAQRNGLKVMPPDINISTDKFEVAIDPEDGVRKVYASFTSIKGFSDTTARAIVEARKAAGGRFEDQVRDGKFIEAFDVFIELVNKRLVNKTKRESLRLIGSLYSIDPDDTIHPLDESRLKDQLELLRGVMSMSAKSDRIMDMRNARPVLQAMYNNEITPCTKCSLSSLEHPIFQSGSKPQIMVITDTPNGTEVIHKKLMGGGAKSEIKKGLDAAGLKLSDCYFTTLVKAKKTGPTLTNEQINGCSQYLDREIAELNPPIIVAMGSASIRKLLPSVEGGVKDLSGQWHYVKDIDATVICCISPGMVYHNPDLQNDIDEVFMTAYDLMMK